MLLLIRKIKQKIFVNKQFHNYLLYALGEMLLVIIGILIALQIDNWNTQQQEREKLENYLEIVAKNIDSDLASVNEVRSERESSWETSVRWLHLSDRDGSLSTHEIAFAGRAHIAASALHHFNANTSGYEALKSSGTLEQIGGTDIESLLYDYYDTVSRIVLEEDDHNEYVLLLSLQVLAEWPEELDHWEIINPQALTDDRLQSLQIIYQEILNQASTKTLHRTPQSVRPLLIHYEKLDHLGRALKRMIEMGVMDFDESIVSILDGAHDPLSDIGDPSVIADGQVSWESFSEINSDANDPRLSYQASNENPKSPFNFRSLERTGNGLHIDYLGNVEWAGIWFAIDIQRSNASRDYSVYEKLVLELKGDVGGEKIYLNIEDRDDPADGTSTKIPLQLTDQWQTYEIDLSDFETANLEILQVPLGFVFYQEPVSFSVRTAKFIGPD